MPNPAAFTIKNNRTSLVVYGLVMLLGISTFLSIGRLEYPDFTIRNAQVIVAYPGRTTVQVEEQVTEPLEQAIRQMAEVDSVKSISKPGISIITVELQENYFELETIWQDMRNRIASTKLPDGTQPPVINDDYGDVFPFIFALQGDGYSDAELLHVGETIRDDLLATDGVAKVEFHGAPEEQVFLEFSSAELAARQISPSEIFNQLAQQNAVTRSGDTLAGRERISIVTRGEFESLEELADYRLSLSGQRSLLRVADLVDVRRGYADPPRSRSHFNGERVLCIAVSMISGGVVTTIGEGILEKLETIESQLPLGLEIEPMFFQPKYVNASVENFLVNLVEAFLFVVFVMFLFAGWRIAMIVGVLVPSATLACFAAMPAAGVQLEMMSIAALIISLGLLVDNAVVISELILVRLSAGMDRFEAVTGAVDGLAMPLLAASGTTIAAFSPIALAEGGTSEFTYSLFAVVSLTLLASWVLSLTIVPMLCYYFLKPLERDTPLGRALAYCYDPYERFLRLMIRLGWFYPALVLALTITAGWAFQFVPNIFFPPNERAQFVVDFELPLGIDIAPTELAVGRLENWLLEEHGDDVESVSSWIGNGGPRWYLSLSPEPANPNYAFLNVLTRSDDPQDVSALVAAVNTFAHNNLPDARVTAKALENGPPVGDPIQIRMYGEDMETLYGLRDQIVAEVKSLPGLYDVRDDWGEWVKQITVDPDPIRASLLGLSTETIASALGSQMSGSQVTTFRERDDAIPVLFRSRDDYRGRPDRLPDIPVFGGSTGAVPLGQVADISVEFLPGSIHREDTLRVMTIKARVAGRFASEALAELRPKVDALAAAKAWPAGYHIEYGGEQEESGESQAKIGAAMPVALSVLALILISQFNSIRRFIVIVLTVPPMLIGVTPGLLLTGSSFGFMTLLGLIALLGIVVNNAILIIDEVDIELGKGMDVTEALVASGRSRLRPIIMTTITTIIGLLPLAIGGGGMWSSMAFAMIFGLAVATALTLVLCPVLFGLFFRSRAA
ncbi:MAG: multidrug efflux pump subunit AcrB [Hyphomicrobiaceae bacterium]